MNPLSKQLFLEALEAAKPSNLIENAVTKQKNEIRINGIPLDCKDRPVYCIATGKASRLMSRALKKEFGLHPSNMLCISPDQETTEAWCISSSHPVPDLSSIKASDKLICFIEAIPPQAVIFFLLSGGTSSLVCKPANGINLQDIKTVNELLLRSGVAIHEINCVRKHLSAIKGGQLLTHFKPDCTLIDLVISDVPSDNLEHIGSGPTILDSSTFQDARAILLRTDLWDKMPENAAEYIQMGLTGEVPETLKPGEDPLHEHHSFIIGSAKIFASTLAKLAAQYGIDAWVADEAYNKDVKDVAKHISKKIKQTSHNADAKKVLIFYGESTVKISGNGKGGRNQELALRGALEIGGLDEVTWLSAGTDGIDGPTDAAGAIVDGSTIGKARERGLDALQFIRENDSYHFHEQMETLLKTGATGNNVMDIVIILIENQGNT